MDLKNVNNVIWFSTLTGHFGLVLATNDEGVKVALIKQVDGLIRAYDTQDILDYGAKFLPEMADEVYSHLKIEPITIGEIKERIKEGIKVTYLRDRKEKGIIKSISDNKHVFVVYNCGGNWDDYKNYIAARTEISDLKLGWD